MKSSIIATACVLTVAAAQPHHQHDRMHQRREISWVTETDVVWETIQMTKTIWIEDDATPVSVAPATQTASQDSQPDTSSVEVASSSSVAIASPSSVAIASPSSVAIASPSSVEVASSTYVASTASESAASATPIPSSTAYVAPPATTPSSSHESSQVHSNAATAEPTPSTTPEAAPSAQSSTSPVAVTSVSSANPSVTTCTSNAPCKGDMTYYDASAGTGACGWNNNTMTESVIALPYALMGTQSNGNPYCGMTVTISYKGKEITATVVDKCMGCQDAAIDLSNHAFDQLEDEAAGRVTCTWWFN